MNLYLQVSISILTAGLLSFGFIYLPKRSLYESQRERLGRFFSIFFPLALAIVLLVFFLSIVF